MFRVGDFVHGKYEIIEEIGSSRTNKIFLVDERDLDYLWVMKVLVDYDDKTGLDLLRNEARILEAISHPMAPDFCRYIEDEENPCLIMEFFEGQTLESIINDYGIMHPDVALEWMIQVCDFLKSLHLNEPPIIYRDLKPSNIILSEDGNIKIIDFGTARILDEKKSRDTVPLGTADYAAPEQFGALGQTDFRTDIYNLGITLRQLVYGETSVHRGLRNENISKSMRIVIEKATSVNPDTRFQTVDELVVALKRCANEYKKNKREQRKKYVTPILVIISILIFVFSIKYFE